MPDTGFISPDNSVNAVWTNPDNVFSSDDVRAAADTAVDHQRYEFPTFNIPEGATIDGIEVEAEGNEGTATADLTLSLTWDNGSTWTDGKNQTFTSASDETQTYGGSTDTWGRTWDDGEFAVGTFELRGIAPNGGTAVNVDHIQVKVYYTESSSARTAIDTARTQAIRTQSTGRTQAVRSSV